MRHVLNRDNARHDTFVTVTARHFVTRLKAPFDGNVHLDHLLYARRQFVALRKLLSLFFECDVEVFASLFETIAQ